MHKSVGPFLAFNELFFKRHQRVLLLLLNGPIVKYWFRWILRIRKCDCSFNTRITEIGPNRFSFCDRYHKKSRKWFLHRTTDFRTHPKYGKRLYFAFWPVWWLLHGWDQLANVLRQPAWNFGFDSLTTYPQAGSGVTAADGYLVHSGAQANFSDLRNGAGTTAVSNYGSAECVYLYGAAGTKWDQLRHSIFSFNTAALGASASISAATLSLNGADDDSKLNSFGGTLALHVAGATPANPGSLQASDFQNVGRTSFGSIAFASLDDGNNYNNFSLNASGLAGISKTGVSSFSAQWSWDINNSMTGSYVYNGVARFYCTFADYAGTVFDPKLVVTYSAATIYYQTLSASSGNSVSLSRISNFLKTLSLSALGVGSVSRALSFYRNLSVAPSSSPVISRVRSAYRILSASVVHSQTLARVFTAYRTLSVTSTFPSSLSAVRGVVSKVLTASTSGIVTVTRTLNIYRTLTSSPYVLAQLTRAKGLYRTLTASFSSLPAITTAVTIIRYVTLPVTVGTTVSLALLKTFYRALTASVSPSVALSQLANHYLTLSRIVSFSATQTRDKLIGRALTAAAASVGSISKAFVYAREMAAATVIVGSITLLKTFYRVLTPTVRFLPAVQHAVLDVWRTITRSSDSTFTPKARSSDASYNRVSRSDDDTYSQIPRQHS